VKIQVKNLTIAGNNARAEMYFDGIRVCELHTSPAEYDAFGRVLAAGVVEARHAGEEIELEFVVKT